ncbi:ABC transporter ATP-binding protein [Paenibacillus donghaensis]|uniref:ABC transporter ATP-binding protein n=1 Tax=Paenibacillus donghaensis TaxID=414771 RepID=A0A2Z2KTT2_9BACL|nr:ABC transporter ATP-binding protein [Paenibacillus donghaensis]ASA25342.1 hypothetical protein B9T62_34190 [Paenibacillus donghaensis]
MSDLAIIKKMLMLFKPYKKSMLIVFSCLIVSTILNLLIPLLVKSIFDEGLIKQNFQTVFLCSLIIFSITLIDRIIDIVKENLRSNVKAKITNAINMKVYHHIHKMKIAYFNKISSTEITNNVRVDIENITKIADNSIFYAFSQVLSIAGGIVGLFIINWKLAMLVLMFIPFKFFIVKIFAKIRKNYAKLFLDQYSELSRLYDEIINGIREIKIFGIFKMKKNEFESELSKLTNTEKKTSVLSSWNNASELIMMQLITVLIYIIGARMTFNSELTVGSIVAFVTYISYVTIPISAIINIGYLFSGIIPSAKRLFNFFQLPIEECTLNPKIENIKNKSILFHNVYYSHDGRQPTLENITFSILEGEKVAVMGTNGSGKTTLLDLILRFHKPDKGTITLGGVDIGDYDIDTYRSFFALVSQRFSLFNKSIKENICLHSDFSEESINKLLEDVQLPEFIDYFNMKIGTNGAELSGGQRQKLALARAISHDKHIYIFDETTSNLDVISEINFANLINERLGEKTIIIVTHKPEILKYMDKIIVIENGEILQVGTYKDLMNNNKLQMNVFSVS